MNNYILIVVSLSSCKTFKWNSLLKYFYALSVKEKSLKVFNDLKNNYFNFSNKINFLPVLLQISNDNAGNVKNYAAGFILGTVTLSALFYSQKKSFNHTLSQASEKNELEKRLENVKLHDRDRDPVSLVHDIPQSRSAPIPDVKIVRPSRFEFSPNLNTADVQQINNEAYDEDDYAFFSEELLDSVNEIQPEPEDLTYLNQLHEIMSFIDPHYDNFRAFRPPVTSSPQPVETTVKEEYVRPFTPKFEKKNFEEVLLKPEITRFPLDESLSSGERSHYYTWSMRSSVEHSEYGIYKESCRLLESGGHEMPPWIKFTFGRQDGYLCKTIVNSNYGDETSLHFVTPVELNRVLKKTINSPQELMAYKRSCNNDQITMVLDSLSDYAEKHKTDTIDLGPDSGGVVPIKDIVESVSNLIKLPDGEIVAVSHLLHADDDIPREVAVELIKTIMVKNDDHVFQKIECNLFSLFYDFFCKTHDLINFNFNFNFDTAAKIALSVYGTLGLGFTIFVYSLLLKDTLMYFKLKYFCKIFLNFLNFQKQFILNKLSMFWNKINNFFFYIDKKLVSVFLSPKIKSIFNWCASKTVKIKQIFKTAFIGFYYKNNFKKLISKTYSKSLKMVNSKNVIYKSNLILLIIMNAHPNDDNNGRGWGDTDWGAFLLCQILSWSIGLSLIYGYKYFFSSPSKADLVDVNSSAFRDKIYEYVASKYNPSDYPSLVFKQNPINKLPDYVDLVSTKVHKIGGINDGAARLGLKVDFSRVIEQIIGNGHLYDKFQDAYGYNVVKFLIKVFEYAARGSSHISIPGRKEPVHIDDFLALVNSLYVDDDREFIFCMFTVQGPDSDVAEFLAKPLCESNLLFIIIDFYSFLINNFLVFSFVAAIVYVVWCFLSSAVSKLKNAFEIF